MMAAEEQIATSWGPTPESTPVRLHSPSPEFCWIVQDSVADRLGALEQSHDFLHSQVGSHHMQLQQLFHQSVASQLSQSLEAPVSGQHRRRKGLKERQRLRRQGQCTSSVGNAPESEVEAAESSLISQILVQAATSKAMLRLEMNEEQQKSSGLATQVEAMARDLQVKDKEIEDLRRLQSDTVQRILLETQRELNQCLLQERSKLCSMLDSQASALQERTRAAEALKDVSADQVQQLDRLGAEKAAVSEHLAEQSAASARALQQQEAIHLHDCSELQKQLQAAMNDAKELEEMSKERLRQTQSLHAQASYLKQSLAWSAVAFSSDMPNCSDLQVLGSIPREMAVPFPTALSPDLPMLKLLQNIQRQSEEWQPLLRRVQTFEHTSHQTPSLALKHRAVPCLSPSLLRLVRPEFSLGLHLRSRLLRLCLRK